MRKSLLFGVCQNTTAFLTHVFEVIGLRSQKEVVGTRARGVVASMQDEHAVWNRPVVNLPRKATSDVADTIFSDVSIPQYGASTPSPTSISLNNFSPKGLLKSRPLSRDGRALAGTVKAKGVSVWNEIFSTLFTGSHVSIMSYRF